MRYHLSMDIDTALDMAWNRPGNPFGSDGFYKIKAALGLSEGFNQSQTVKLLEGMKAEGMIAIPGEGCNYPSGKCEGHLDRGVNARVVHA